MVRIKRYVEIAFLVLVAVIILAQALAILLSWWEGRQVKKEIWANSRASVTKINPIFPPRLLVEFENQGRWPVPRVRLVAIFESNGIEVARAEREYGEIRPGQKRTIMLESVSLLGSTEALEAPTRLRYRVLVFPGSKKPLPEITGEFDLARDNREESPT